MRKQFVKTIDNILNKDKKLVTLLGDIGVWGFNEVFKKYPKNIYNIGILEQATIGVAAGLAKTGYIPLVHTIAPFLVERALEQLKVDFCYQKLGGNFVSVGGSYDYAALGCTHHCPGDVGILKNLPGMQIVLPGTAEEFDSLFNQSYNNGRPTYFRLSERANEKSYKTKFGKAKLIKKGKKGTVIAVGPMLGLVKKVCEKLDVNILYYTCIRPFDSKKLKEVCKNGKVFLIEPYYSGVLTYDVVKSLGKVKMETLGIECKFLRNYGKKEEHDKKLGFEIESVKKRISKFLNE